MVSSFLLAVGLLVAQRKGMALPAHVTLIGTVIVTTLVWLAATWMTPPTDRATLHRFYRLARPAGPGWAEVRRECGGLASGDDLAAAAVGWVASCVFIYSALFGAGLWLVGRPTGAAVGAALVVASGVVAWRAIARLWG